MFVKGKSGNPSGKRKGERAKEMQLQDQCRKWSRNIVQRLVRIVKEGSDQNAIAAAKELLDRGYGRPSQTTLLGASDGGPLTIIVQRGNDPSAAKPKPQ